METKAEISDCCEYRYALWRKWAEGPQVLFVMLNPSTADENADDPTIRKCIALAKSWGFGSLAVGNLFAFRTPSPVVLKQSPLPVGDANNEWLRRLQSTTALTVAAWGNHGTFQGRNGVVRSMLANPHVLGLTKLGEPRHPLYMLSATQPQEWDRRFAQLGSKLAKNE